MTELGHLLDCSGEPIALLQVTEVRRDVPGPCGNRRIRGRRLLWDGGRPAFRRPVPRRGRSRCRPGVWPRISHPLPSVARSSGIPMSPTGRRGSSHPTPFTAMTTPLRSTSPATRHLCALMQTCIRAALRRRTILPAELVILLQRPKLHDQS